MSNADDADWNEWDEAADDGDRDGPIDPDDGTLDWGALGRLAGDGCDTPGCDGGHGAKMRCGMCRSTLMKMDYVGGAIEVWCGNCDARVCRIAAPTGETP